jgi:hypothetical protein
MLFGSLLVTKKIALVREDLVAAVHLAAKNTLGWFWKRSE